jgi:hypothetical protein
MLSKLREDIRKYEEENNAELKGRFWPHMRCINCPASFLGCPMVRRYLETGQW